MAINAFTYMYIKSITYSSKHSFLTQWPNSETGQVSRPSHIHSYRVELNPVGKIQSIPSELETPLDLSQDSINYSQQLQSQEGKQQFFVLFFGMTRHLRSANLWSVFWVLRRRGNHFSPSKFQTLRQGHTHIEWTA